MDFLLSSLGPMPPCITANGTGDSYVVSTVNVSVNTTSAADSYDGVGAMQFIICTVSVYSFLGVFFLLVIRFRQGTTAHKSARTQADAINNYLKSERTLKLEGHKMKMLKEMEKHVESIDNFEQRMRLKQIRDSLARKDLGLHENLKSKESGTKKGGRKKSFQFGGKRLLGKRRISAPEALGRMGFSVLYMEPREETLQEVNEESTEEAVCEGNIQASVKLPVMTSLFNADEPESDEPETERVEVDIEYIDN